MNKKVLSFLAATAAITASSAAAAAPLWDNGNSGSNAGLCDNSGTSCGNGSYTIYDDFQLTTSATISSFSYLTNITGGTYSSTNWSIWKNDPRTNFGSGPDFSGTIAGTVSAFGGNSQVNALGLSVALTSGTYWLGLQNNLTNGYSTYVASGTSRLGPAFQLEKSGANFNGDRADAAFSISGDIASVAAVPEPASWAMMILGMGAVGFAVRRRKSTNTTVRFA